MVKFTKMFFNFVVVAIIFIAHGVCSINQVNDGDLVNLLGTKENVIALFTKSSCHECDELENVVENIYEELQENLGAVVVKLHNSNMVNKYDPTHEPALIYFRRGIPMLYYGDRNEDEILQTFSENRDPIVKELSDENFEHLTQASTGSTTGDWFIFFYSADCVLCQRMQAVWEAVGSKLKRQLSVARVNRLGAGITTANRFGIKESPEFIYIRHGKFHRYRLREYNPKNLIEFAQNVQLQRTKAENVPPASVPMNDFLKSSMEMLLKNPIFLYYGAVAFVLAIVSALILKYFASKKAQIVENKNKKAK